MKDDNSINEVPAAGQVAAPAGAYAALWANIPSELRERHQWVIAAPDKVPYYVDTTGSFRKASVTNSATWLCFEGAAWAAYRTGGYIGFVLSPDDPFAVFDFDYVDDASQLRKGQPLDPNKHTSPEMYQFYIERATALGSYTELSISGKGFHVWIRGVVGDGIRHGGIELYDRARYMICTGNAVIDAPIAERQTVINETCEAFRPRRVVLDEQPAVESDEAVYWKARACSPKAWPSKFDSLWLGEWQAMRIYPSQSEADQALMGMLAAASPSNEQCRRLFRMSGLGKRPKARRDDYLNRTLMRPRAQQVGFPI